MSLVFRSQLYYLLFDAKCVIEINPKIDVDPASTLISAFRLARFEVPDESVSWDVKLEPYDPMLFDAPHLEGAPYADPMLGTQDFKPNFNQVIIMGSMKRSQSILVLMV